MSAVDELIRQATRRQVAALDEALLAAFEKYEPTMNFTVHCYRWSDPPFDARPRLAEEPYVIVQHCAYVTVPGGGCQIINHPFGEEPPRD